MLQQLSLVSFLHLAKDASRVAIYREIAADRLTPIGIVERLPEEMKEGMILESGLNSPEAGRYSFITFGSIAKLKVQNNTVLQQIGEEQTTLTISPFAALRQLLKKLACASEHQDVNFMNGAVGFMTYDAVRLFESIPDRHTDDNALPEMLFHFYQTTLVFDHLKQKLIISMIVEVGAQPEQTYQQTQEKITALVLKLNTTITQAPHASPEKKSDTPVDVELSDEQFMTLVEQAKHHIIEGDAFQIVLSRSFKKRYNVAPLEIYRALRRVSPAPYMFYIPFEQGTIVGASPEKLISVHNRQVEITPIAGTRPRTEQSIDTQITDDLLNDTKEVAEHMMLVDLARNDLGAVCKPGTVTVHELLKVKHFSHVSHITSAVTGQLSEGKDALDALAAAFPAGTLSGAPKIRAMEIIDALETSKRGLYGGAICRLDYQGNLDSCIAIRMAVLQEGIATVRTGAGIVYDSNPLAEALETRHKAKGVLTALTLAEEGLE